MMKNTFYTIIGIGICLYFFLASCKSAMGNEQVEITASENANVSSAKGITDMALIYHGWNTRIPWNMNNIKHYVYREENGKTEWLFDGFLFLEIWADIEGAMYDYRVDNEGKVPAGKEQWEYLIQQFFKKGVGIDGIEYALDQKAQKGFYPPYKRQVVICIPTPQPQNKNWGKIGRKALDFTVKEDRLTAVEWYVNRILDEWKKKDYKHLDLGGFYWLHERLELANGDGELVQKVSKMLKKKNLNLCWIPYYGAEASGQWDQYGFDIAYQQPNYFFRTDTPMEIMTGALRFAKEHNNMALEMEFDDRVERPEFRERFYTYLTEFERVGAWENRPMAYYDGSGAWLKMAKSSDPEMMKMYKALGDILIRRQGKFSKIVKK